MFNKKDQEMLQRFDKIDKSLSKLHSDIKKLKELIESLLNINTDTVILNDEELWQREQKKVRENGF